MPGKKTPEAGIGYPEVAEYILGHKFNYPFIPVAVAFWEKYLKQPRYNTITIADVKQIDSDRICFIRRQDSPRSNIPHFERIIYDRKHGVIVADMFEKDLFAPILVERCMYQFDQLTQMVEYSLSVFKVKYNYCLRKAAFDWGKNIMEKCIKDAQKYAWVNKINMINFPDIRSESNKI